MEYYKSHTNETTKVVKYKNDYINNRAIYNDEVYIKNGEVVGIKTRNKENIVGILCLNKNTKYGTNAGGVPYYLFKPLNNKYSSFYVASKRRERKKIYVVIKFHKWEQHQKNPIGVLIEEIGDTDILNNEYKALIYKHNLYYSKYKVPKFKLINDLRREAEYQKIQPEYYVFSIDPEGCKDIDDAFHYKELKSGFEVGVHITDIYQYFRETDVVNLQQCSSIYTPTNIRHLLPEVYSQDICSLIKNKIRKTVMILFTYDKDYKLINTTIRKVIVKIRKNYSYEQVDKLLSYEEETNLHKFFKTIKSISSIEYNSKDEEIKLKEVNQQENKSININDSHSAVEYYMIKANEVIATRLYEHDPVNLILRIQSSNKQSYKHQDIYNPLNQYLKKTSMEAAEYYIPNKEYDLQCINKQKDNIKLQHSAIGLKYYTHFTSPIRRLTDMYIHIQVAHMLNNEELLYNITDKTTIKMNDFQKKARKLKNDIAKIDIIYKLTENYETMAYITDYTALFIIVYIPEFNISHKIYNYSIKIKKIVNIELTDEYIMIKYGSDESLKYNRFQEVSVRLNSLIQEDSIQRKLNIHIL